MGIGLKTSSDSRITMRAWDGVLSAPSHAARDGGNAWRARKMRSGFADHALTKEVLAVEPLLRAELVPSCVRSNVV